MRLRTRIILLTGLMLIIATTFSGIATFRTQENALLRGIDSKLEATARLAREILPVDYHDKISGTDSVSEAEYLRIVDRWNRLCGQMGLEYIWSLLLIDGKTVFTSGSSTSKDVRKGDHAKFFETHSNPELYAAAFATLKPQYQINDDKWGRIKVVLLPFKDASGRPFLFGASMKTTEVDALMRKTIWQSLEISAGILFLGTLLSVLFSASLVRPLEKLSALAKSITKGNWGQVVETSGTLEIRSLADSINEMSRSIENKITERKQAEEALRESEEKISRMANEQMLILNCMPIGVTFLKNRHVVYSNPAFDFIFGYETGMTKGLNTSEFYTDSPTYERVGKEAYPAIAKGGTYTIEMVMKKRNGEQFFCRLVGQTVNEGKPEDGAIWMFQDITVQKRMEEELRKSEDRYKTLFSRANEGIFIISAEGKLSEVNESLAQMHGYSKDEMLHMSLKDFDTPEASLMFSERMCRLLAGEALTFEVEHYHRDGHVFPLEVSASLISYGGESYIQCFHRDITERRRAEEETVKLQGQLQQAQKMEAIGTMAGGIAHDFNNILAAIIGYTEMAMAEDQKEIQRQYLQQALKGTERAADMVKQILTFSRQDSQEKKPLDIKILLKESIKFLRASIPATIEIRQHFTDNSSNIIADSTQMHQIIMNLCTNAAHAMKRAGGILKIELSNIELAKGEILRHPDLKPGPYVRLTVSDTGHGIDPVLQLRIFDPFFTTKSKDEGTGLGLSVVYGIVKSHDGIIHVYSEPGKGASFSVYLPRIIPEENVVGSASTTVNGGTERILFVDDEPDLVDIGTSILSSLGYAVTGVNSSIEALDQFRAEPAHFDLVFTDMTLPKMTGIELACEILQIRPDIPIILCSGIHEPSTGEKVKSLGIKAYCIKPLTRRELSRVIRDTLDGHKNTPSGLSTS
jgi:PAS domain S-box-containing protein